MTVDKGNMIAILKQYPNMVKTGLTLGDDVTVPKDLYDNIAVCGMGSSGFTGDFLNIYMHDSSLPVFVIKDYTLPKYIGRKTLLFAISHSGNTEETISAYRSALRKGCKIIAISSGGKLEELSKLNKTPHIKVPAGGQPRISTPLLLIPLLNVLSNSGLIDDQDKIIKKAITQLRNSASDIEKSAKDLAKKLVGKTPIVYTSQKIWAIAEKWKTDINENAKTTIFYNMIPEFCHNEICGYQNPVGNYHTIIISDKDDHERVKKRIKVFKNVAKKYKTEITEIALKGDNFLTRLLSTVWMGAYIGYFIAIENGIDPTPVNIIEDFKKQLVK